MSWMNECSTISSFGLIQCSDWCEYYHMPFHFVLITPPLTTNLQINFFFFFWAGEGDSDSKIEIDTVRGILHCRQDKYCSFNPFISVCAAKPEHYHLVRIYIYIDTIIYDGNCLFAQFYMYTVQNFKIFESSTKC